MLLAEQHARPLSQLGRRGALAAPCSPSLIGSLAAYALVRIRFQVKLAAVAIFLLLLVAVIVAVAAFGVPLAARRRRSRSRSSCSRCARSSRRFKLAVGNNDIEFWIISNRIMPPIVAVLPIYVMFQQLQPARHADSR